MKNKIYPFLLGLSCIVIVALVSFKNSEKSVEKEQMIIMTLQDAGGFDLYISTGDKYEYIKTGKPYKELFNYSVLLNKVQQYTREGWVIINTTVTTGNGYTYIYTLERDKQ